MTPSICFWRPISPGTRKGWARSSAPRPGRRSSSSGSPTKAGRHTGSRRLSRRPAIPADLNSERKRRSDPLVNLLQHRQVPLVRAQRVEVGVFLHPVAVVVAGADGVLEVVEGLVEAADVGVDAGDVVEQAGLVGGDGDGAVDEFETLLDAAGLDQRAAAQVEGADVLGIQLEMAARLLDPGAIGGGGLLGAAEAAVDLGQEQVHLVILGAHLDRLLVEARRLEIVPLGDAGAGVEVERLVQLRIERDRLLEVLRRL